MVAVNGRDVSFVYNILGPVVPVVRLPTCGSQEPCGLEHPVSPSPSGKWRSWGRSWRLDNTPLMSVADRVGHG